MATWLCVKKQHVLSTWRHKMAVRALLFSCISWPEPCHPRLETRAIQNPSSWPSSNTGCVFNLLPAFQSLPASKTCFRISGSKSQSALWNAITAGMGIKGKPPKPPLDDPRSPEEILADEFPAVDVPEATEKTAIRSAVTLPHRLSFADRKHTHRMTTLGDTVTPKSPTQGCMCVVGGEGWGGSWIVDTVSLLPAKYRDIEIEIKGYLFPWESHIGVLWERGNIRGSHSPWEPRGSALSSTATQYADSAGWRVRLDVTFPFLRTGDGAVGAGARS